MRALSATLPKITKAILEKGGREYAALVTDWAHIMGPSLAQSSMPEKLAHSRPSAARTGESGGGVLTIRVTGGAAMEIQHREPQLIERINSYLGHRAVTRLKLVQGPLPARRPAMVPPPALTPTEAQAIDSAVADVADSELQGRLARFGRALAGRQKPRRR